MKYSQKDSIQEKGDFILNLTTGIGLSGLIIVGIAILLGFLDLNSRGTHAGIGVFMLLSTIRIWFFRAANLLLLGFSKKAVEDRVSGRMELMGIGTLIAFVSICVAIYSYATKFQEGLYWSLWVGGIALTIALAPVWLFLMSMIQIVIRYFRRK